MNFFKKNESITKVVTAGEIILPFILSLISQRLSIGRSYDFNLNVLFLNYILWLVILIFFLSLFKKHYLGLSFYILFFLLFTLIDRYRIKFLNEPLRFNDIHLIGQFPDLFPFFIKYPNLKKELILSFIALIITFISLKKTNKIELKNIKTRIILLIISLAVLTLPYFNEKIFNQILASQKIIFNSWYRLENCQNNGVMLCFLYDLQFIKHQKPENYNSVTIQNIFNKIPQNIQKSSIKPNIIVIMSESLWDAKKLPKTTFSLDPLTNLRQDIKGNFISPTFGGGTANVEFEFLTGLSNFLFEDNSFPYTDLIRKNIPSLFTIFKDNGYLTSVIHPYSPQFYNRKNVYKYFGLDKFISLDQMPNFENAGPYVSDKFFTQEIIKQFNSVNQSQFIFAISMQNHDLYEPNRFKNQQIKITGPLEKTDKDTLQSYIEGINLTDKSYQFLKEELKKQTDKPTIIVMFGDHLPFLNDNYSVYEKSGFISKNRQDWSEKDKFNIYSTPLIIWSNYSTKIPSINNIGPAQLSTEILNLANISSKYQFRFIENLKQTIPYLTKQLTPDLSQQQDLIKDYNLIQYDLLFGKQYLVKN